MSLDQEIAQEREKARRRRETDLGLFLWMLGLCVTYVVPWFIGFALRSFSGGSALADWAGGSAAIFILVGALLVLRPWSLRVAWVVVGFVAIAVASAVFIPLAVTAN